MLGNPRAIPAKTLDYETPVPDGPADIFQAYDGSANPLFGQAVSKIAIDPVDDDVIYVATGSRVANSPLVTGAGVAVTVNRYARTANVATLRTNSPHGFGSAAAGRLHPRR